MTADEAARRWADTWRTAWAVLDVESIVALYADGVVFSSQPFRSPYLGRDGVAEYVTQAFGDEDRPVPHFGEPIVAGDRASVSWWTELTEDGNEITLAGTSVLRFDDEGLVIEQWDTWNQSPGRVAPPDWTSF